MIGVATRHQPVRMCASCRTRKPKTELSRYTKTEGQLQPDKPKLENGRGLYFCSDACLEQFTNRKIKSHKSLNRGPRGMEK